MKSASIDAYLKRLPPEKRSALQKLRRQIAQRMPTWAYIDNKYAGHDLASMELAKALWTKASG